MWDPNNLQPACRWHHDLVKQRLELDYARGHATADDLKLDSAKAIKLTQHFDWKWTGGGGQNS